MTSPAAIPIEYFSDVLCVWAYAAQIRLDELRRQFGPRVELRYHFIPLFGCIDCRIHGDWKKQGGLAGFAAKVRETAQQFPHISVHPEIWTRNVPPSSGTAHHFLKAVQLLQRDGLIDSAPQQRLEGKTVFEAVTWDLRSAFFRDLENIADRAVQLAIAERHGLPVAPLLSYLDSGAAMARLCQDMELRDKYKIAGSPSIVLNEGRQILYGNVGYQLIAANVEELLDGPGDHPSWC